MRYIYLLKRLLDEVPSAPSRRALFNWLPDELSYVPKTAWLATATVFTTIIVILTGANNLQAKPVITVYVGGKAQTVPADSKEIITVREALELAEIEYTEEDLVEPALNEEIDPTSVQIRVYQKRLISTANQKSDDVPSAQLTLAQTPENQSDENIKHESIEYTVAEGDTLTSIAESFDISPDTIRWANDIKKDQRELEPRTTLKILPITGFEYQIKASDSAISLAQKYQTTAEKIILYNDAEIDGLIIGETIILPDGAKPAPPKPKTKPTTPTQLTPDSSSVPKYKNNTYTWGNCTWYASNRRAQIGRPIPNRWGNANLWDNSAAAQGYKVNDTPAIGAIMVQTGTIHVAIVERINPDGSILVSEMNWNWQLGVKTTRTIPGSSVSSHSFIH